MNKVIISNKYKEFVDNIKENFSESDNSIHKARNEIKVIDYIKESLVVKSFKVPHLINKIMYTFFKDSKAKKSYYNSIKIGKFAPNPIAYIEFKKGFLLDRSFFISENFDYDLTIREPLLEKEYPNKEEIFRQFAKFTYSLHEDGICHLDYSPGNILIKENNGTYIFKIVDINRMQFKTLNLEDRLKNFSKLWAKNEDLEIILKEYSKLIGKDEKLCLENGIAYSQKHKDKKNLKKRLRGQKVND